MEILCVVGTVLLLLCGFCTLCLENMLKKKDRSKNDKQEITNSDDRENKIN